MVEIELTEIDTITNLKQRLKNIEKEDSMPPELVSIGQLNSCEVLPRVGLQSNDKGEENLDFNAEDVIYQRLGRNLVVWGKVAPRPFHYSSPVNESVILRRIAKGSDEAKEIKEKLHDLYSEENPIIDFKRW